MREFKPCRIAYHRLYPSGSDVATSFPISLPPFGNQTSLFGLQLGLEVSLVVR